jgi:hydrogenase maturation protease
VNVLVSGMGNDLCRDDGFGIEVVRRFAAGGVPSGVRAIESGIGGIALVQELMDGYDMLIIVDAVDRSGDPGTTYLLHVDVPHVAELSDEARAEFVADMHYTVPSKALILARALGVLPRLVYLLGCQPAEQELGIGLSAEVEQGVTYAVEELRRFLNHRPGGEPSSHTDIFRGRTGSPASAVHGGDDRQ